MKSLIPGIKRFLKEEDGASAVEYGLLVALIALAIAATVYLVGQQLNTVFNRIKNCLTSTSACV